MSTLQVLVCLLVGLVGSNCGGGLRQKPVPGTDAGLDRPDSPSVDGRGSETGPVDAPQSIDILPVTTGTGGESAGGAGATGTATGGAGGAAGDTVPQGCLARSTRLCKDDPDLAALGNCGGGTEICAAGAWGPCSIKPAAKDTCALLGDDASCNGKPNEGCPCLDGDTQPCGPAADLGICKRGKQTCTGGTWGACVGAVFAAARDCTSAVDNNCDGSQDNVIDATCACALAATRPCAEHAGKDGMGSCKAGSQACVVAPDRKTSSWGVCVGSVAPAAKDTCAVAPAGDENCNGMRNEGCTCVEGSKQPCGPAADVGICKRGMQTCTAGAWGTCVGAVNAAPRDCTSAVDNDCDGRPDNTVDAVCACAAGSRACDSHAGDGKGPCKAGSQTCVIAANKQTSAWGTCTGAVGPAPMDGCDATNDANCNGVPHEGCTCVNGATRPCGGPARGICKGGTQVCSNAAWGTTCPGEVVAQRRDCTSTNDNDCNGTPDNVDSSCACPANTPGPTPCLGNNTAPCKSGTRVCMVAADKSTSTWSACTGAVAPAPADTCDLGNDANCNTIKNEGCACINSSTPQPCMCGGTQTCSGGKLSACVANCGGPTPMCVNQKCVQCGTANDCAPGYATCTGNSCTCRMKKPANLIPNSGFDTNVAGWTSQENMATWSGRDADSCPASGSITAPGGDVLEICVQNVLPATPYHFGFKYIQDQGGGISCVLNWARDAACLDGGSRFFVESGINPTTSWASIDGAATSDTDPPTKSLRILCRLNGNSSADQFYLNTAISGF